MTTPTVQRTAEHILRHLHRHRHRVFATVATPPPLFVAVQGPQGSGKTYLTSQLRNILASPPHFLSVATLSIDDLYLPHKDLVALSEVHRDNVLLQGRGQPGTHDVRLGTQILRDLQHINEASVPATPREVKFPLFDKSLHNGAGDRVTGNVVIHPPLDVVVLEGWCVGFRPIIPEELEKRWSEAFQRPEQVISMIKFRKEDILELNQKLDGYSKMWDYFTVFIQVRVSFSGTDSCGRVLCSARLSYPQIKPVPSSQYLFVYKWRLEQEHHMKSKNGGKGMSDAEVRRFLKFYYSFEQSTLTTGTAVWIVTSPDTSLLVTASHKGS
jgi:D-glycerate 3-kinase